MAKFIFIFVVSLLALQSSDAYPKKVHPSFVGEDVARTNVQELIDELNKVIQHTASRFVDLYAEMNKKITEIENDVNIKGLMKDFRQQVQQMLSQDGAESCNDLAQEQVLEVTEVAERSYFCKLEVNEDMADLRKQKEVLSSKLAELMKEISTDVFNCMKESRGNLDKFTKCMEQNVQKIKQELQDVDKEIQETFNVIEQFIPVLTDKISACFADEELIDKMQDAEENIKNCISGKEVAPVKSLILGKNVPGSNVQDLIQELQKLIRDTTSRFTGLYAQITEKIMEIENEVNLNGLLNDFKQQVEQMMAQNDTESCNTLAQEQITIVDKFAEQFYFCKIDINEDLTGLRKQIGILASKVKALLKEVNHDINRCMKESHGHFKKFSHCMEKKIKFIKRKLQVVEKKIQQTFNVLEQSLPVFSDRISACLIENKKELIEKMQVAEDNIKNCIAGQTVTPVSFKTSGFVHADDYFKYLANEIKEGIQLPEGVMTFEDKINEIVSKHNMEVLIVDFKETIEKVMSEHEKDDRLCGPKAYEQLAALGEDSQIEVKGCVQQAQQVADTLNKKFIVLADKARELTELLNEKISACAQEHLRNMFGFVRCMEDYSEEMFDQVDQLQMEVLETTEYALQTVEDSLKDLDVCLVNIEDKTTTQGKLIVDTLNQCVNNTE